MQLLTLEGVPTHQQRSPSHLLDIKILPHVQPYPETRVTSTYIIDALLREALSIKKVLH